MINTITLEKHDETYTGSFYEEPLWKKRMGQLKNKLDPCKDSELPKTMCSSTYSS